MNYEDLAEWLDNERLDPDDRTAER